MAITLSEKKKKWRPLSDSQEQTRKSSGDNTHSNQIFKILENGVTF